MGDVFAAKTNSKRALACYEGALKHHQSISYARGMTFSTFRLGNVYRQQNSSNKAIEYYLKAIKMAQNIGLLEIVRDSYRNISEIFESTMDFDKALENFKQSAHAGELVLKNEIKSTKASMLTSKTIVELEHAVSRYIEHIDFLTHTPTTVQ
jgi:tetratricopeptide (TPR) repeat protein